MVSAPEKRGPDPETLGPHEYGIRHLAFFVDDCDHELERLISLGGKRLGETVDIGGGIHTVFCRDPFGNILELCEVAVPEEYPTNLPGSAVYSAGKRAVISMTEMPALELGKRDIRVNCVCPGYTVTALGSGEEGKKLSEAFTALRRAAEVGDMAGAYVFLAADESGYMTGQALKIDGGWSCGPTEALLELVTGSATAPG